MNLLTNLLDPDQLLKFIMPILAVGLIVYIFITRKLAAGRARAHQEEVHSMNRERSTWRITRQRQQAIIYNYEETIRQQQDVIDELTGASVSKFLHLN